MNEEKPKITLPPVNPPPPPINPPLPPATYQPPGSVLDAVVEEATSPAVQSAVAKIVDAIRANPKTSVAGVIAIVASAGPAVADLLTTAGSPKLKKWGMVVALVAVGAGHLMAQDAKKV